MNTQQNLIDKIIYITYYDVIHDSYRYLHRIRR